uniref:DEP domain containing MTOR-interacting protein n=1 Tax=Nothobranchius furzeri TaxID=105023 RepID=A0A8C6M649_NOTFU
MVAPLLQRPLSCRDYSGPGTHTAHSSYQGIGPITRAVLISLTLRRTVVCVSVNGGVHGLMTSVMNRGSVGRHGTNAWNFSSQQNNERTTTELRLHEAKVIKDRRHHLRTYPNCFVAKELIDWLMEHKEATDRDTAIKIMQKLLDQSIIHHVCDEHREFKDMKLFYRFRKDDGTFPLDNEAKVFMRGQRIYEKLMNTENNLVQTREEEGVSFERTLVASEFIDWLLQEGEMPTREETEQLGRRLLEHGIIQHVTNKHHFVDGLLLYQFRMNFRRRRRLMELLQERSRSIPESYDSPFCLRKQHSDGGNTSFLSVSPTKEIKVLVGARRSSMSSSCGSSGYYSSSPTLSSSPPVLCNPKSVVKRQVSPEELLTPGGPFVKKTFTIVGDAVGWGFVVRGSKPCHIQAVDPGGPAAAVGMKPCLYRFCHRFHRGFLSTKGRTVGAKKVKRSSTKCIELKLSS